MAAYRPNTEIVAGDINPKVAAGQAAAAKAAGPTPAQNAALNSQYQAAAKALGLPATGWTLSQIQQLDAYVNKQNYAAAQGPQWVQDLALGINLGALGIGAGSALGLIGGTSAGTGTAAVTDASLAAPTGGLTAANTAAPALGGSLSTDVGAGTIGLGSAPTASVLPTAADFTVGAPSLGLGASAPTFSTAASTLGSSALAGAGKGAVTGAVGSTIRGGNPVTGALTGAVSGGVGGGVGDLTGSSTLGSAAGQLTGYGISSATAPSKTGGTHMADPTQPMADPTGGTVPATVPGGPTATATQGMPSVPGGMPTGAGTTSTAGILNTIGTGVSDVVGSLTGGLLGTQSSGTSMAPYLAIGALGFAEADKARKDAQAQADTVKALGAPYTAAGTKALSDYQSGTLSPAQQKVVDTSISQGNTLIASDPQLQAIYQQAFGDYQSGTLRPADQLKLDQTVAAQKAQVRQNLSSMGITDSTILAAQDQQIDNNAIMMKQSLLDAQFATGNQAFSTWLSTTEQGQNLIRQGQEFAVTSLQQTFNNALNAGQTGMNPVIQSVQMQIASDAQLGTSVSDLLGNLAKAYAFTQYQNSQAAKGGAPGGASTGTGVRVPGASTGQVGGGGLSIGTGPGTSMTVDPSTGMPTGTSIPTNPSTGLPTSSAGGATGSLVGSVGGFTGGNVNTPDTGNTGAYSSTDPIGGGSLVTDPTTGLPYGQTIDTGGAPTIDPATQAQLDAIYSGSFNPATASTGDLVSYFAGTG